MKNALIILSIALLLSLVGCGPAGKLRRAEKLIKKAELQGASWSVDTVFTEVPTFIKETRVDTLVSVRVGETVTLIKDRLQVKYVRLKGDTVFIDAKCAADTFKIKVPVNIYRTITAKGWLRWWHFIIVFVAGAIIGRFVIRLFI